MPTVDALDMDVISVKRGKASNSCPSLYSITWEGWALFASHNHLGLFRSTWSRRLEVHGGLSAISADLTMLQQTIEIPSLTMLISTWTLLLLLFIVRSHSEPMKHMIENWVWWKIMTEIIITKITQNRVWILVRGNYFFQDWFDEGISLMPRKTSPKNAMITPFGLYEFFRMPFGLRNAAQAPNVWWIVYCMVCRSSLCTWTEHRFNSLLKCLCTTSCYLRYRGRGHFSSPCFHSCLGVQAGQLARLLQNRAQIASGIAQTIVQPRRWRIPVVESRDGR